MNIKINIMQLSLLQRLKPEFIQKMEDFKLKFPRTYAECMETLADNNYFTDVRFGTASDICSACEVRYFGDLFITI